MDSDCEPHASTGAHRSLTVALNNRGQVLIDTLALNNRGVDLDPRAPN